jgi:hypothetical protein
MELTATTVVARGGRNDMRTTLSETVVATDHQLEQKAARTRAELAKHRWHWTLDASNPARVTTQVYAKSTGRAATTILDMVNGYAEWARSGTAVTQLNDYLARAKLRGEDRTATEAVAQAKGIGVEAARRHHAPEVRAVKAVAQERATRRGTTFEEEAPATATRRAQHAKAERSRKADAATRTHARVLSIEGKIAAAMRYLRFALDESEGVVMSPEDAADIADQVGRLKAIANLLEVRLVGTSDVDWDAEMAKLVDGVQG